MEKARAGFVNANAGWLNVIHPVPSFKVPASDPVLQRSA